MSHDRVIPSQTDSTVRAASTVVGGPWGRHGIVGRQWFWTPIRILLLMVLVTLALAWWQKSPCQTGNWLLDQPVKHTFTDPNGKQIERLDYVNGKEYVRLCYSDIIPLYGGEKLDRGAVPYKDHPVEYPVLTGFFMYAAAQVGNGYQNLSDAVPALFPSLPPVQSYYQATVLMLVICALVMVWATARLAGRRVWDAAMVALAPLLVVHAFTNWDLFAVALATAGMLAWSRRKHEAAGILFGLGTAAKLYPLFLLGPLLVLCLRCKRMREFGITFGWTLGAWLFVNGPIAIMWPDGWKEFFKRNSDRGADPDTLWNVAQHAFNTTFDVDSLNVYTVALFIVVCVAVAALGFFAPEKPRVPQLAFLVVAGFLLTNKVWSPQYSLWLLPLAVLARPSWRLFLAWQVVDAFLWFPRMYWWLSTVQEGQKAQGYDVLVRGLDVKWYLATIVVRDVLVLLYCAFVVRDILRPARDPVRADGLDDDPAGGVLDRTESWQAPGVMRNTSVTLSS